jgi:hypothetical protein
VAQGNSFSESGPRHGVALNEFLTFFLLILESSDDGAHHFGLLRLWTVSIVRYYKEHSQCRGFLESVT